MAFLKKKNCARTTLSSGITAGATAMTVVDASQLPSTTDFLVTIWNKTLFPDPCDDPNHEIVRVTGIAGNVLTITRGQENTTGVAHSGGDAVEQLITAGTFEEIETTIDNHIADTNNPHAVTANQIPTTTSGQTVQDLLNLIASELDFIKDDFSNLTNGSDTDFELSNIPVEASLQVFLSGMYQRGGSGSGFDYELNPEIGDDKNIRFAIPPRNGAKLIVHYIINN